MRSDVKGIGLHRASRDFLAIAAYLPAKLTVILQVPEIHIVMYLQDAFLFLEGHHPGGTEHVPVLFQSRVGPAVRVDQSIHAEILVMGIFLMVSSIEVHLLSVDVLSLVDGMVAPLPDHAADHAVMLLEDMEIILQVPRPVAHGVAVLAEEKRPFGRRGVTVVAVHFLCPGKIIMDALGRGVHSAVDIQAGIIRHPFLRHMVSILIVGDPGVVIGLGPLQGLLKPAPKGGFIAHGPGEDTGPVLVPDDAFFRPVHDGFAVPGIVCQPCAAAVISLAVGALGSMALVVRFVHHIEAVPVAELVELWRVGIMAGTDAVHIVLFHQGHIFVHLGQADGKSGHGIAVMTVRAVNLDFLAVEQEYAVLDCHFPQSQLVRDDLALRLHHQSVEIGGLRAPEPDVLQGQNHFAAAFRPGHHFPFRVLDGHLHRNLFVQISEGNLYIGFPGLSVQAGLHEIIVDALLRAAQQIHVTEDAAHAELVLILHVAAVAPFQHQHRQQVLPLFQKSRHIELRCGMGHLAVAHVLAVDPHIEAGIHALEIQECLRRRLILMPCKSMAVGAAGILMGHIRGIQREGIPDIGVLMSVVSVHLPHGGHGNGLPVRVQPAVLPIELLL